MLWQTYDNGNHHLNELFGRDLAEKADERSFDFALIAK